MAERYQPWDPRGWGTPTTTLDSGPYTSTRTTGFGPFKSSRTRFNREAYFSDQQRSYDMQFRQSNRVADAHFDRLAGLGLTPQEMVGASNPGGAASSGGGENLLGNGLNPELAAQMSMDERRQMTALKIAEINAATQIETARISANPGERQADFAEQLLPFDLAIRQNQSETTSRDFVLRLKQLSMGADNIQTETILANFTAKWGVSPVTATDSQWKAIPHAARRALAKEMNAIVKSRIRAEYSGATSVAGEIGETLGGLGRGIRSFAGQLSLPNFSGSGSGGSPNRSMAGRGR